MKWSWDAVFKFDTLIIGQSGALWLARDQSQTLIIANPDEVQNVLTTQRETDRPLRIMLDWPHTTIDTPLPPLKWWERQQFIHHMQTSHNSAENFTFQQQFDAKSIKGLRVDSDQTMLQWFAALSAAGIAVEGIYSLPYECGRALTTPILFATKTLFNKLRFIFTDGQGGYFHRLVPYVSEVLTCQEIERTLYYLCRKYTLNLHDISVTATSYDRELSSYVRSWNVLETAKNYPEELILSLIFNSLRRLQNKHHPVLKKVWQLFLWPRLLIGLGIPTAVILAISIGALSWYIQCAQTNIQTLNQQIASLEQQVDKKTYDQNMARLAKIKAINKTFMTVLNEHTPLLSILRKLISPQHAIQIKQLVLISPVQSAGKSRKLIIEYTTQQPSKTTADQRYILKQYADFLGQQFPKAKVHHEHDFNTEDINSNENFATLIAATIQLDNIQ